MSHSEHHAEERSVLVLHEAARDFDLGGLRERLDDLAQGSAPLLRVEHIRCGGEPELLASLANPRADAVVVAPSGLQRSGPLIRAAIALAERMPVAWVELTPAAEPVETLLLPLRIHGRGIEAFAHALATLRAQLSWPRSVRRYGERPDAFGTLRMPNGAGDHPVVVLLHGGGFRDIWGFDRTETVAVDLAQRGIASWNVEFSRIGPRRGHWEDTFHDVADAIDHILELSDELPLDPRRIAVVGHSSGGLLSLWAGARAGLAPGLPGARPRVTPSLLVSLAGLGDLREFSRRRLDFGSADQLVDAVPEEAPDRFAFASPRAHLPLGIPQLLVHGRADPARDLNDIARLYREDAAAAGDDVELWEPPMAGHSDLVDPESASWGMVANRLQQHFAVPSRPA